MADDREDRLEFIQGIDETYTLHDLLSSEAEMIAKGNLGNSYKVFLKNGELVVVKRLKGEFTHGIGKQNLQELGEFFHENLLPFKAYMLSKHEKLLVYKYMHMGSLSSLLHEGRGNGRGKGKIPLDWETRMKISYGVARGIEYIHSRAFGVCHGNIRSSNVFLTNSYVARLSEFGIAPLFPSESKVNLSSEYRAPEVKRLNEVCQQGDVYSFGVLLLELFTGKDPVQARVNEEGFNLPKWVRSMFQEKVIIDVFDESLRKYKKKAIEEQMVKMLQLAICCTFENPSKRPLISEVVTWIREVCRV